MADMMADGFALRAISILPAISSFGGSDRSGSSQTNLVVVGGMNVET